MTARVLYTAKHFMRYVAFTCAARVQIAVLRARCVNATLRSILSTARCTTNRTRMWANAQPDGRPAEHRWRPLFNAAKFG